MPPGSPEASNPQCLPGASETQAAGSKFYRTCSLALPQGLILHWHLASGRQELVCFLLFQMALRKTSRRGEGGWGGIENSTKRQSACHLEDATRDPWGGTHAQSQPGPWWSDSRWGGGAEHRAPVLGYSGRPRSQVCWSPMNSHSHKQMNKEAKNQARPGCNRDSRDASVCWLCGAPTHC